MLKWSVLTVVPRNKSRVSPPRGGFYPGERALGQETSATQARDRPKARARELEGDFQLEPPLPRSIRCFAFGLDTETETTTTLSLFHPKATK